MGCVGTHRRVRRSVVAGLAAGAEGVDSRRCGCGADVGVAADRNLRRLLRHGVAAGSEPEIERLAGWTLSEAFRLYLERTGEGPDEARVFVAHGMLINVLLAVNATEHLSESPALDALALCTFGSALAAAQAGPEALGDGSARYRPADVDPA